MKSMPFAMIFIKQMDTDLTKILGFIGMIIIRILFIQKNSLLILIPKNLFDTKSQYSPHFYEVRSFFGIYVRL